MNEAIDAAVREVAAKSANWFAASYIARVAGADSKAVYERLEQLVAAGDLERHFELISPNTGNTLGVYSLGDEVPVGQRVEVDDEREEPFVARPSDIYVSFSATPKLRRVAVGDAQKKSQRGLKMGLRKIRSTHRAFRTS